MQLQFLGATDTVTGSKYLLREGSSSLLVDCGLFQGYKALRQRNWARPPLDLQALTGILLTHAHIDHSGYLPLLVRQGYEGPVWCSPATEALCRIMLPDSARLQEEEADYANRHHLTRHEPALPLYDSRDVQRCLKLMRPMPWGQRFEAAPGMGATLQPAGHIIGASFARIESEQTSILFSGDLGRPNDPVLKPPTRMAGADYLVVESTYGDRLHNHEDVLDALAAVINRTAARGGTLVIPSFAVGRTQNLLHLIHTLKLRGAIHQLPVYLDSPMAEAALQVYRKHAEELRLSRDECKGMAEAAHIVQTPDESRALSARKGPMIIIAGSGMATGGRVVHHLKSFLPDHRNTVLLPGFQAAGTRGATLASGSPTVRIHGQDIVVRAEVTKFDHLSAHADADEILDWLKHFDAEPRTTFITHGEPAAADALRLRIERELHWECHLPYYLETVNLP